jgi:hypothetical protein
MQAFLGRPGSIHVVRQSVNNRSFANDGDGLKRALGAAAQAARQSATGIGRTT